jgi:hypothetical protein
MALIFCWARFTTCRNAGSFGEPLFDVIPTFAWISLTEMLAVESALALHRKLCRNGAGSQS